jgi:hypothetical protein
MTPAFRGKNGTHTELLEERLLTCKLHSQLIQ